MKKRSYKVPFGSLAVTIISMVYVLHLSISRRKTVTESQAYTITLTALLRSLALLILVLVIVAASFLFGKTFYTGYLQMQGTAGLQSSATSSSTVIVKEEVKPTAE